MNPLTQTSIDESRAINPGNDWFFTALKDFLHDLEERLEQVENGDAPHGIPNHNGLPCGPCNLTFYFYFTPGGGYRNAIWIDVDNVNGLDIWLRVGFNIGGNKKVDIYSNCLLNCPGIFMIHVIAFGLNHLFRIPVGGIFKTNAIVHPCTFDDILDEICLLLQCACNGNCV